MFTIPTPRCISFNLKKKSNNFNICMSSQLFRRNGLVKLYVTHPVFEYELYDDIGNVSLLYLEQI